MDYADLKRKAILIGSSDFYDGLYHTYAGTSEFWLYNNSLYIHELHTNSMTYTGHTTTYVAVYNVVNWLNKYNYSAFRDINLTYSNYVKLCERFDIKPCNE